MIKPMNRREFERIVAQVLDDLPQMLLDRLDNVEIVVESYPDAETLEQAGVHDPMELLGYYHGIPLTERGLGYTLVLPDKISIYQVPIERTCRTPEAVRVQVRKTIMHELAHHFGIDDDRLHQLGAY
jgi:predicted Zn-dependent protease with MMP-like domain